METTAKPAKVRELSTKVLVQLLLLGIGYCLYSVCRLTFPVGLKDIGDTYHFTAIQIGTLGTGFLLGQAIVDIPAGYMTDRFNRRYVLAFGSVCIGATLLGFILFTLGFGTALFWRIAFGCAEGFFNICLFAVAGMMLPGRRAFLINVMAAFYGIGGLIGPPSYALLFRIMGQWQAPLGILALVTMAWGAVLFVFLQIDDKDMHALSARKKAPAGETFLGAVGKLARIPGMWKALSIPLLNLIPQWGFNGVGAYMLATVKHIDPMVTATVFAVGLGAGPLIAPFMGYFADKFGRRYVIGVLSIVFITGLYLLFASDVVSTYALLFGAVCIGLGTAIYWLGYTVVQDAVPPEYIGFATGITGGLGYFLASTVGFFIGIVTYYFGYLAAVWIILIIPEILVAICAIVFIPTKPKNWDKEAAA